MSAEIFLRYGIALAIGMLVGMQRQFSSGPQNGEVAAGVRTIALLGLAGCGAAHLSDLSGSPLPLAACLVILGAFLTAMYFVEASRRHSGLTTQAAALVTFLAGSLAYHDRLALAGALGVTTTALLSLKPELHNLARNLTREDVTSTLKFAILGVVFLPLLPNRSFWPPPWDMLNPFQAGLFVVLISGVGFVGYVVVKVLGPGRGLGLLGLVGGLVSSTAVTLGFTQHARRQPELSPALALGILASWVVMFARTLALATILDPEVGRRTWIPLGAAMAAAGAWCLYLRRRSATSGSGEGTQFSNPFELAPAVRFGILFLFLLTAARAAQLYFGEMGTYLSSFAAGLLDVDTITYSMTRLTHLESMDPATAGNAVLLACLANSLLKGGFATVMGPPELRRGVLTGLAATVGAGLLAALVF